MRISTLQENKIDLKSYMKEFKNHHLRFATVDDASSIVDLQIRGWKHSYQGIIDQAYLDSICQTKRLQGRLEHMAKAISWTFVVEHEHKIIGVCDIGPARTPEFGRGEIYAMYVDKDHHRQGVGGMLWNAAFEKLKRENLSPVIIIALSKNFQAQNFYKKMGGIICAEIQTPIGSKLYDEIVFRYEC